MSATTDPLRAFVRHLLLMAALPAVGCSGPGFGEDAKFEAIPIDEARLVLHAPGLEPVPSSYQKKIDGITEFELGRWQPPSGSWPDASLILLAFTEASPSGMTWVREPPLEDRIRRWFSRDTITVGEQARSTNRVGPVEYQRFTRNEVIPCVFIRIYGDTFADQRSYRSDGQLAHGNHMIRGWYCAPPNTRLESHVIDGFIAGIGVKDLWSPRATSKRKVEFVPAAAAAATGASDDHVAKVKRVVFTTGISDNYEPVDDIRLVSMNRVGTVYIFVEWQVSLRHHAEFFNEWRVYDGGGYQKLATSKMFEPRSESWSTWLAVQLAKSYDQPGEWKFEVYFDNEKVVEEYLTVQR
jgi:hypothetical protein